MNVFISHAAADRSTATKLAHELKAQGFSVSSPTEDIVPGENLALKVGKALESAAAIVVLLSPESAKSQWVQSEISYALTTPKFQGRLIPVMLKPTEEIPWILHDLEVLRGTSNTGALGRKVIERLRGASKGSGVRRKRFGFSNAALGQV